MDIELEFHATLRDAVGEKTSSVALEDGATVEAALHRVANEHDTLGPLLFRNSGELRPHLTIARNDEPLFDGREAVVLADGDRLVLSPGVAGGAIADSMEVAK